MTETLIRIPTLETERLRMRAPVASDFEPYAEFCASDRAAGVGGPYTRVQAFDRLAGVVGHWVLRGYGRWVVADRQTDIPLGVVGLMFPEDWPEPEIAWSVFEAAEGKGFVTEAALRSRDFAYEVLGWETAISCTIEGNERSENVAKRMGATFDGTYDHPRHGMMNIWRHLSPEALQ